MNINLGCGNDYREGYYNVDINRNIKADCYKDVSLFLEEAETKSAKYILASHILEHIPTEDIPKAMNNLFRILKDDGILEITVPDFTTKYGLIDPTHKSIWTDQTIDYWCKKNDILKYFNIRFYKLAQLCWGFDMEHMNITWLLGKQGNDVEYNKAMRDLLAESVRNFMISELL